MGDMDMLSGTSAEEPIPNPGISRTGHLLPFSSADIARVFPLPVQTNVATAGDLIDAIITEDQDRSAAPLPGPTHPPPELLCQDPHSLNHYNRTFSPGSPPVAKPVLVPRGTSCKPHFHPLPCSPKMMASTHLSQVTSSSAGSSRRGQASTCPLPSSGFTSQSQADTEILEQIMEKPRLVVVEEPKDRGMRFRYECEGRSAGSILGASSTEANKTQPAIEIQGPIDRLKMVTVTVSLVTKDPPHRPHPHCLVGKDCPNSRGICVVSFNPRSNRRHSFANLGIQCVRRKELDISLQKRRSQNIDPFQTGHSKGIEDMDMNSVRLCFQCELEWEDGRTDSLNPVVSKPIYDKKATTTSQLKICSLNQSKGSCSGKTEIYMLCDKVQKDDIEILFRYGSWKANGEFAQTDVHRQIAIVFKTPPYQDQNITEEVEVSVALRRISDQMESEPVPFTYLPHNRDPYEVKRKRKAMKMDMSFSEKPCMTEGAASSEQNLPFLLDTQNMVPEHRPCHAPPAAPGLPDMHYCEGQDATLPIDNTAIINELLESPVLCNFLSDPNLLSTLSCGDLDFLSNTNTTFTNMDVNPNLGMYQQDFSHFNDLQFSMLVNENQNTQPELQDDMVQVKTEEEL
ncbi:transcription factor p65 isoform 2-T2 [Pholidichthys leucotaenia]